MRLRSDTVTVDPRAEAALRHLRTLLDEARGVLSTGLPEERTVLLDQSIARLQREAEALAPDFGGSIRIGVSRG